ncbi:putative MPP superfamily phosphohydrolase [Bradyrhizobium sp. USDA 4448]
MISRRHLIRSVGGLSALGFSTAAYGVGIEPELRPRITRYRLAPRQWPADFPLRIAVIADIHACEPWMSLERIEAIVDQANALKPDLVVLLGDYVAGHHYVTRLIAADEWARVLTGLKAPLGIHAVLGNHDYWDDKVVQRAGQGVPVARRALQAAGIPVYENDAVRLTKDGRSFWLAGLGDQLAYAPAQRYGRARSFGADDLTATLARITDDAPVILLAHEPNIAWRVPARVALQLSGHTHGGQVRLFGWSPALPPEYAAQLVYGHFRLKCDVVVSGGLGCSIVPVRVGVPPEIVEVTLGRAPAAIVS